MPWLGWVWGCESLRTLLTSALSSSASCWLSLVQAASIAVIYSKLGGCLGVTTKVGPFSQNRPLHWGQMFVGKVNDPLRVRFFIGRTLVGPAGGCGGRITFPGGCTGLLGRLSRWLPGGVPSALPACPGGLLLCPAWGALEDWGLLVTGGEVAWEELFSSLVGVEPVCWEELSSSEGRCTAPGRELLPSPGGRWAIAGVWLGKKPWLFAWLFTELIVILLMLLAWLLRELLPSDGRWTVAGGELLPSPGGRRAVAGVGLWGDGRG